MTRSQILLLTSFKRLELLTCLVFFSAVLFAQEKPYRLYAVITNQNNKVLESYSNGDSLSANYFLKCTLSLLRNGTDSLNQQGDMHLSSYEVLLYNKGKFMANKSPHSWTGTQNQMSTMPDVVVIDKIKGTTTIENKKIQVDIPSVTFYKATGVKCVKGKPSKLKEIKYQGKIVMAHSDKTPLVNQKIILKDDKDIEIQSSVTNKYGDFSFDNVNIEKTYKLEVPFSGSKLKESGGLIITRPDGTFVGNLTTSDGGFSYELLPTDLIKLVEEKEEDTEILLKHFSESQQSELVVSENIYYDINSVAFKSESVAKLDKIILAMNQNTSLKVSIYSHTDAQGDDAFNLALSEKRAKSVLDYFVSKGIIKERITAKGLGETEILNRCKNYVDCSELEHKVNRRIEFKFTK